MAIVHSWENMSGKVDCGRMQRIFNTMIKGLDLLLIRIFNRELPFRCVLWKDNSGGNLENELKRDEAEAGYL